MKRKNLWLGFLLGVVLCALCCLSDQIELVMFAAVVPFFFGQLWLLRRTKKLWLRLVPVYPIVLLLIAAGYFWFFGKGWDALAALIFALLSIAPTVGCILAAMVHRFAGRGLSGKWLVPALVLLGWFGAWLGQEISLGYWDRAFIKALSFVGGAGMYRLLVGCRNKEESLPPPLGADSPCQGEMAIRPKGVGMVAERSEVGEGPSQSPSATAPPEGEPRSIFQKPDRQSLKLSAALALGVFLFLTVAYMLLSPWLDLSAIPEKLRLSDITAENFPLIAAYITLGNSFLEELFFRGFAFLTLRKYSSERFAYLVSGITFALYHVSILEGWFHPAWMGLFIVGLAVGGMLFDWLDRKGSLWCGWFVHMSADLAIMLIGMRMFGIL